MKAVIIMVTASLLAAFMLREHHHDCAGAPCLSLAGTNHTHAQHSHACDDSTCPLHLSAAVNFSNNNQHPILNHLLPDCDGILPTVFLSEPTASVIEIYHHYVEHLCRWLPRHAISRGPPMA